MYYGTKAMLESLAAVLSSHGQLALSGPDHPVSVSMDRIE